MVGIPSKLSIHCYVVTWLCVSRNFDDRRRNRGRRTSCYALVFVIIVVGVARPGVVPVVFVLVLVARPGVVLVVSVVGAGAALVVLATLRGRAGVVEGVVDVFEDGRWHCGRHRP